GPGPFVVIKIAHHHFALAQHFLNIAQALHGLGNVLRIRELDHQLLALLLGAQSIVGVAVGLLHLFVVDVADALLGFGGFLHGGIEQDEVLIFGLGLRHAMQAAFAIPAIGDGELGLGQELAGVVGVDQRVQRQAGDFV